MARWFNTTGPCDTEIHYTVTSSSRLPNLERFIAQRNYFVLHAPRQVGKTTAMLALAKQLTDSGQYAALVVSAELGAPFSDDPGVTELAMLNSWRGNANMYLPADCQPPSWPESSTGQRIEAALTAWSQAIPRPLVLFIDEIDTLQDAALISVLRQLRNGFRTRPHGFPQSVALIGLRDVRDYKAASDGSARLTTSSPFNIKAESITMRNFTAAEVAELYQQHTDDTGQIFSQAATELVFELTDGQPWLVNALARQLVEELAPAPATTITPALVQQAKEILIKRQDTHLDSLAERLQEQRIKAIIEPMLAGLPLPVTANDDRQYLVDLGLLKRSQAGGLVVTNPIYREVLVRFLVQGPQDSLPMISPTWLTAAGKLDTKALLNAFLTFWRQHGEPLLNSAAYHEIAPHLVLMAFLHRVINGGGTLEREYAIGSDRMDLCLRYGDVTLGIELKVWRDKKADPLETGLDQLDRYLARLDQAHGWLVIFDRRAQALPMAERLATKTVKPNGQRSITVIRA
ncbi:MAG: ATP-binding protein [Symploca sp. SIO2G7]|nr:ATP-binding protein [Symploca sp. SIO2G7]